MIVITLTKVPKSLRGDLTKWYQEIQTGVYVGNVSARIRDSLWDRILKNIGRGEATMVYNTNNELGYQFRTTRHDRDVVSFDGIPLMVHLKESNGPVKHGFSNAAKFHKAKVMTQKVTKQAQPVAQKPIVAIDIETTGLDAVKDRIISIGAVKRLENKQTEDFYRLVQTTQVVPENITKLTGITNEMLAIQGVEPSIGLQELKHFLGDLPVVGYNLRFDEMFLTNGFKNVGQEDLANRMIDVMPVVKRVNEFLDNYRLKTVLSDYGIANEKPHNALADARATLALASKLIETQKLKI